LERGIRIWITASILTRLNHDPGENHQFTHEKIWLFSFNWKIISKEAIIDGKNIKIKQNVRWNIKVFYFSILKTQLNNISPELHYSIYLYLERLLQIGHSPFFFGGEFNVFWKMLKVLCQWNKVLDWKYKFEKIGTWSPGAQKKWDKCKITVKNWV
jgi:hypothetical protein